MTHPVHTPSWTKTRYGYAREYSTFRTGTRSAGEPFLAPDGKRTYWYIAVFDAHYPDGVDTAVEEYDVEATNRKAASAFVREYVLPNEYADNLKLGKVVLA